MNICIVDDYQKSVDKTVAILSFKKEYEILFTAEHGGDCLKQLNKHKQEPDIILMDVRMRKMDGCNTTNYIKRYHKNIKILALSGYSEYKAVQQAIAAGADGYVFKGESEKVLLKAIERIVKDNFYIDERLVASFKKEENETLFPLRTNFLKKITDTDTVINIDSNTIKLTQRERQFIQLAATALNYNDIAAILSIDKRTAETYYTRIAKKLSIESIKEMVVFATQFGLVFNTDYSFGNHHIEVV